MGNVLVIFYQLNFILNVIYKNIAINNFYRVFYNFINTFTHASHVCDIVDYPYVCTS